MADEILNVESENQATEAEAEAADVENVQEQAEKIFTQAEVDAIVKERLARVQKKGDIKDDVKPKEEPKQDDALEEVKALREDMTRFKAENHALKKGVPEGNLNIAMILA